MRTSRFTFIRRFICAISLQYVPPTGLNLYHSQVNLVYALLGFSIRWLHLVVIENKLSPLVPLILLVRGVFCFSDVPRMLLRDRVGFSKRVEVLGGYYWLFAVTVLSSEEPRYFFFFFFLSLNSL